MIQWFLKRFTYTRELEARVREQNQMFHAYEIIKRSQAEVISEYQILETGLTKLTLDEAHELLSACVDYQRALIMVSAPDPVQHRIIPIIEKYGITIERNTLADDVTDEELKEIVEYLNAEAGGPKSEGYDDPTNS